MKRTLCLFFILLLGMQASADAQILKKLEKAVKEAAEEVLNEKHKADKQVQKKGQENSAEPGSKGKSAEPLVLKELENSFEASTKKESYGAAGEALYVFSEDRSSVATSGLNGSRQIIVVNGKPGPDFDGVDYRTFVFSSNGNHYAYVGVRASECILVVDGKESDVLPECFLRNLQFSQDGSVLAYLKKVAGDAQVVMINGKPGPEVWYTMGSQFIVRGNNVFYIANTKGATRAKTVANQFYKNNQLEFETPAERLAVSEDGSVYAVLTHDNAPEVYKRKHLVVINGKRFPGNRNFIMDERSGAVSFLDTDGTPMVLWKDQRVKVPKEEGLPAHFVASPDNKQFSFVTSAAGRNQRMWLNGKPGQFYYTVSKGIFSGDGKDFLYTARVDKKFFLVINGKEIGPYDHVNWNVNESGPGYKYQIKKDFKDELYVNGKLVGTNNGYNFKFSPDGSRYASAGIRGGNFLIDGEPVVDPTYLGLYEFYSDVHYFLFSPKGNRLAYSYFKKYDTYGNDFIAITLDGQEYVSPVQRELSYAHPTFSPEGTHFAFLAPTKSNEGITWRLFIDMEPGPIVSQTKRPQLLSLRFIDDNTVKVIGQMGNDIIVHTVSL